jgi:hypothetical protein
MGGLTAEMCSSRQQHFEEDHVGRADDLPGEDDSDEGAGGVVAGEEIRIISDLQGESIWRISDAIG